MIWRKLLIGVLTTAVAVLVFALLSGEQAGRKFMAGDAGNSTVEGEHSDYFMEGVISRQFDATGKLTHVLRAPRIDHFEAGKRSLMQQPEIDLMQADGPPWTLSARKATADHGRDALQLKDDVRLRRADTSGSITLQMETAELLVDMAAQQAETSGDVRFVSPGGQVTGTGLHANFATEQLDLLANVKGHYETPSP